MSIPTAMAGEFTVTIPPDWETEVGSDDDTSGLAVEFYPPKGVKGFVRVFGGNHLKENQEVTLSSICEFQGQAAFEAQLI